MVRGSGAVVGGSAGRWGVQVWNRGFGFGVGWGSGEEVGSSRVKVGGSQKEAGFLFWWQWFY